MNKKEKLAVRAIHGSNKQLNRVARQHKRNLIAKAVARFEQMTPEQQEEAVKRVRPKWKFWA